MLMLCSTVGSIRVQEGSVEDREMFSTFNMGLGMILVAGPSEAETLCSHCSDLARVGSIQQGQGVLISGIDC